MSRSERSPGLSRPGFFQRGLTIVELLSVTTTMGLVLSAIALIIGPTLDAQNRTQAKVDTVQAAAMALYRVERDVRNTDAGSIWTCTTSGTPVCVAPSTALTATSAIVIATAYTNGTGQFQLTASGTPNWQGASVYWVDADGNLTYTFDPLTSASYVQGTPLRASDAQTAVSDAMANGGKQLARWIQQMSIAEPGYVHQVSFQLQTRSTVGAASNETTYQTDLETRN